MHVHKNEKADLRVRYPLFVEVGLIAAIAILIVAFRADFNSNSDFEVNMPDFGNQYGGGRHNDPRFSLGECPFIKIIILIKRCLNLSFSKIDQSIEKFYFFLLT